MAYIGNTPISVAFLVDTFSGDGSTTAFTMTVAPANTSSILVAITGVVQDPSTYSVAGTTLTFSAAPPSGTSNISVRYLGIPASGVTTTAYRTVTNFTATAGQTTFSVPSYTVGYIDVYRNGVRLTSADYTASTGTTVVLAAAATVGDSVVTESFYVSSVLNAVPTTGGSITGNLNITGNETVTGKVEIQQDAGSNNRVILRGTSGSSYRWNLDNYGSSNDLRIFREDDGTAASGVVYGTFSTDGSFKFNSGYGSAATAYGCRAWVNFNGTGTVAIRASGNVSSITDNGTGDYTVNFTNAMTDANFSAQASATDAGTVTALNYVAIVGQKTSSSQRVALRTVSGAQVFADALNFEVAIFR